MSSTKATNIERDWLNAGMKVVGKVEFVKVNGTTYAVTFRYKADVQQPELRVKMKQIARNNECFLFVDFAQPGQWEEGTVTFIHQLELLDWEQTLKSKLKEQQQSFGYLQEQDTSIGIIKYLLGAVAFLAVSIEKAKDDTILYSNGREFWSHFEEITQIQTRVLYIKEVDLRRETMETVLSELFWKR